MSRRFSALQRAENSSILFSLFHAVPPQKVSVLFSEPKIPQFYIWEPSVRSEVEPFQCSSASRKFLNRHLFASPNTVDRVSVLFSEPKIPQCDGWTGISCVARHCFSALQRAENSSICAGRAEYNGELMFQCSSASRKFLNLQHLKSITTVAEFQCSSASRKFLNRRRAVARPVARPVSVLFSEPKIPQFQSAPSATLLLLSFSALQRAENSSIPVSCARAAMSASFQCSSASRKFLNRFAERRIGAERRVSVLFSEPKIPQSYERYVDAFLADPFQCSSASRKFLNRRSATPPPAFAWFQCSSASRKFLN